MLKFHAIFRQDLIMHKRIRKLKIMKKKFLTKEAEQLNEQLEEATRLLRLVESGDNYPKWYDDIQEFLVKIQEK